MHARRYEGARTSDKFLEFIKAKLDEDKGFARVEALDKLAQKFTADGADIKAVLKEAEKAAGKVEKDVADNAKLYITIMKKAVEKVSMMLYYAAHHGACGTTAGVVLQVHTLVIKGR